MTEEEANRCMGRRVVVAGGRRGTIRNWFWNDDEPPYGVVFEIAFDDDETGNDPGTLWTAESFDGREAVMLPCSAETLARVENAGRFWSEAQARDLVGRRVQTVSLDMVTVKRAEAVPGGGWVIIADGPTGEEELRRNQVWKVEE